MKPLILITALSLALPALAQENAPPETPEGKPLLPFMDLFSERSEEMMREFMEEIAPEMERLMGEMLPELERMADMLGGLVHYEMPEILPNGDIIIRRKKDAPPLPDDFLNGEEPIEL